MSLREDELSRSLQTVDTSLIQARAALEAAYMEVQRLMVVKQQVCTQLNSIIQKLSLSAQLHAFTCLVSHANALQQKGPTPKDSQRVYVLASVLLSCQLLHINI